MRILAIETSCDETAVAVLECSGSIEQPSIKALSQALYSQTKEHAPFGGVFPALGKREHVRNLVPLTLQAFGDAKMTYEQKPLAADNGQLRAILSHEDTLADNVIEHIFPLGIPQIDAIAVTQGPGLEPALWVGLNFAKALSYAWNIPIIPTNHMEGHIISVLVNNETPLTYPALALLVSGGHTELVRIDAPLSYERIGETRDDAVGEAYDKVARLLGLPYPGGPQISKLAAEVREQSNYVAPFVFPRPMIKSDDYDFSFAGLKTAVLYKVRELSNQNNLGLKPDERAIVSDDLKAIIAYEFEEAAVDVLVSKTKKALTTLGAQTLVVGGGVIANTYLRERLVAMTSDINVTLFVPTKDLSTDNAVMIGAAAYLHVTNGETYAPYNPRETLAAYGTLRVFKR